MITIIISTTDLWQRWELPRAHFLNPTKYNFLQGTVFSDDIIKDNSEDKQQLAMNTT